VYVSRMVSTAAAGAVRTGYRGKPAGRYGEPSIAGTDTALTRRPCPGWASGKTGSGTREKSWCCHPARQLSTQTGRLSRVPSRNRQNPSPLQGRARYLKPRLTDEHIVGIAAMPPAGGHLGDSIGSRDGELLGRRLRLLEREGLSTSASRSLGGARPTAQGHEHQGADGAQTTDETGTEHLRPTQGDR
jgi:hypothetical protein